MNLRPLELSAKAKTWRMSDRNFRQSDMEWSQLRSAVLQRDDYTCQFCAFRARKWQEIHHIDDDHNNNTMDNLVTACCFCHQVHHIGLAGMTGSARLAYLPELTQAQIHDMIRAKLVLERWLARQAANAQAGEVPGLQAAVTALNTCFEHRCRLVRDGFGSDSPVILGDALIATADNVDAASRAERLRGIRLLPTGKMIRGGGGAAVRDNAESAMTADADRIPAMVDHWIEPSGPFAGGLMPQGWQPLLRQYQHLLTTTQ